MLQWVNTRWHLFSDVYSDGWASSEVENRNVFQVLLEPEVDELHCSITVPFVQSDNTFSLAFSQPVELCFHWWQHWAQRKALASDLLRHACRCVLPALWWPVQVIISCSSTLLYCGRAWWGSGWSWNLGYHAASWQSRFTVWLTALMLNHMVVFGFLMGAK